MVTTPKRLQRLRCVFVAESSEILQLRTIGLMRPTHESPELVDDKNHRAFLNRLDEIRNSGASFLDGLTLTKLYVAQQGGFFRVLEEEDEVADNAVEFTIGGLTATVFQPYPDIDRFYYEA